MSPTGRPEGEFAPKREGWSIEGDARGFLDAFVFVVVAQPFAS